MWYTIQVTIDFIMTRFVNYFIVACLAVLTWEYGHPYIPGLVVDHDHGSEVTDCHTH